MTEETDHSEKAGKKKSPSSKSRYMLKADAYYCQICGAETKGLASTLSISKSQSKSTVKKNLKVCSECLSQYNDKMSDIHKKIQDLIV